MTQWHRMAAMAHAAGNAEVIPLKPSEECRQEGTGHDAQAKWRGYSARPAFLTPLNTDQTLRGGCSGTLKAILKSIPK